MRLVAIYNVWKDWDLLEYSLKNIRPLVDGVIIVGSEYSNFGEYSAIPEAFINQDLYIREPQFKGNAAASETDKRNFGLDIARERGYTHFLTMDADEFYPPDQFNEAKQRFHVEPNLQGLVCQCETLFARPTLSIGLDVTLVPFIHKLTPTIRHEFNRNYPFAWIDGQIRIDPTRSLNINSGVERIEMAMVHASWIRKDYQGKINNSTAKANLERSTITEDLVSAKDGYFCKFYQKRLYTVENRFGIPDYGERIHEDIQQGDQPLASTGPEHKP